jgi:hypothetical protein
MSWQPRRCDAIRADSAVWKLEERVRDAESKGLATGKLERELRRARRKQTMLSKRNIAKGT